MLGPSVIARRRARFGLGRLQMIARQQELLALSPLPTDPLRIELVVLHEGVPHPVSLRLQKCVRHRAADQDRVGLLQQVLDDRDLVRHLRAAEDADERPCRVRQRSAEVFQFLLHQETGRALAAAFLDDLRHAFGGRVGAMRANRTRR